MDSQQNGQQEHQMNQNGMMNGSEEMSMTRIKGSEDKKIFVGGIAYDVTNEDLSSYFSQYGEVTNAQVKYDRATGRSRGFAFVEFTNGDSCKAALGAAGQTLKGKPIEVKPAKSRENKKVFIGGLPAEYPENELRAYFEQFGKIEDVEWPIDKMTKAKRNFAFVVFEDEEAANAAAATPKQTFNGRECDVKKAVPQNKRFPGGRGGMMGGMRGGYGGGRGSMNSGGWYGQTGGWQMGAAMNPYGGAAASQNSGWGDWYANAAQNYYQQGVAANTGYGSYGTTTGYDAYSQNSAGSGAGNQRSSGQQAYRQQQQY